MRVYCLWQVARNPFAEKEIEEGFTALAEDEWALEDLKTFDDVKWRSYTIKPGTGARLRREVKQFLGEKDKFVEENRLGGLFQ